MAKTSKNRPGRPSPDDSGREERPMDMSFNFGGFLGKLGSAMEKLVDLAESGQTLAKSGEIKGLDPEGKLRGVYGFSVKTALGDQGERGIKIEPFGNIRRESTGETVVEDVREPMVDVYDEEDHVLVLAEIPGVSKKDVELELSDSRLTIVARRGEKRYRKEVELPASFSRENMRWECANGILKIRFERQVK
jgi:HSP20 family protein